MKCYLPFLHPSCRWAVLEEEIGYTIIFSSTQDMLVQCEGVGLALIPYTSAIVQYHQDGKNKKKML